MEIIYWDKRIVEFIDNLDYITSARAKKTINALEEFGYMVGMPDSKSLGKGLFELRTLGKKQLRILYVFHNNKVYLIHCFIKKTWRIAFRDINYARQIQKIIMGLA